MSLVKCFRCSRTGMYYPADYVEMWGIKYGHGLGCIPVSEALVNEYHFPIAEAKDPSKTMHPVANCKSQIDFCMVEQSEYLANLAILTIDDPDCTKRGEIMKDKQLQKSMKLSGMFPDEVLLAKERIEKRKQLF